MSGQVLRVISRRNFDFSHLEAGEQEARMIVGKIPTAHWSTGRLLVRTHNLSVGKESAGAIEVRVVLDASTDEDPGHAFVDSDAIAGGSVAVTAADEPGGFTLQPIEGDLGSTVGIVVAGMQDAKKARSLAAEISAELILKGGC